MDDHSEHQEPVNEAKVALHNTRSKPKILPGITGIFKGEGCQQRYWLTALVVLLALQVILSIFQVVNAQIQQVREESYRKSVIQSVQTYTANVDALTVKMLDDYKKDVYNNSKVDNTAKQQVMGNEYTFNAIMLLIKQNSRLMEMLSQLR
jgi:hypothetical protein